MSKTAKDRPRVEDINKCSTPADIAEYLEDNPFKLTRDLAGIPIVHLLLEHALYKKTNLNFTQYQLKLQALNAHHRAFAVLLRIMEVRFSLDRLDL